MKFLFKLPGRIKRISDSPGILYLHIGMHKTGTTFLQFGLSQNRGLLKKYGICYPEVGWGEKAPNQHTSMVQAIESGELDRAKELVFRAFRKAVHVLLSAERFGPSLHRHPDQFLRWFEGIRQSGHDIKAIVYIRRQDLYAQSAYRAGVRNPDGKRLTMTFQEFITERANSFDYRTRLEPWRYALGTDNLIIRPFERGQWRDEDLMHDFLNILGIDSISGFRAPTPDTNRSFSAAVTELLRRTNSQRNAEQQRKALKLLDETLLPSELYGEWGGHTYLNPAEQQIFIERYTDSNRIIATEWLGRADGRLFYDKINTAAQTNIADLSDPVISRLQNLIQDRLSEQAIGSTFGPADAVRLGLCN